MSDPAVAPTGKRQRWGTIAFVALMLALTALFVVLGLWQWQRLGEKEALIATVASRMDRAPASLPAATGWATLDTDFYDYRPLTVTGTWLPEETVLVFTSLAAPRGRYSGPGYWVMTALALPEGGTVIVNRGFVPQESATAFADGGATAAGVQTLTGVGRAPERSGSFTPGADVVRRIEWVRDPVRLARLLDPDLAPVAPIYLDLPAGEAGALPQGGETVVAFPNNHLGYAMTWFGFALLTPVLLAFWLLRRPAPAP